MGKSERMSQASSGWPLLFARSSLQKGNKLIMKTETIKSVWKLILILASIGLLAAGCSPNTQGSVNVASDTCKTVITTNEGSWDALTNSFTCSGTVGQQYCARVDLDSNGNCIEYESYTEGDTASAQPTATPPPVQQIPINNIN